MLMVVAQKGAPVKKKVQIMSGEMLFYWRGGKQQRKIFYIARDVDYLFNLFVSIYIHTYIYIYIYIYIVYIYIYIM